MFVYPKNLDHDRSRRIQAEVSECNERRYAAFLALSFRTPSRTKLSAVATRASSLRFGEGQAASERVHAVCGWVPRSNDREECHEN